MSRSDATPTLDDRAAAAARDLAARAGARPVPPFATPDEHDPVVVPLTSRRHNRRPLAVAAAVVLAVAAAGAVVAIRDRDHADRRGTPVQTGTVRAHGAAWLPDGFVAIGAGEDPGEREAGASSELAVYGPTVDDPRVAVATLRDWSVDDLADDGGPRFEADGVAAIDLSGSGLARHAVLIDDPASPGDGIVALSPVLGREALVGFARATTSDGPRATIRPTELPAGWSRLADDPGGVFAGSPIGGGRSGRSGTRAIAYGPAEATRSGGDPTALRMVTVETRLGDASVLAAVRVTAETTEPVEIDGHDALLSTAPSPAEGPRQLTATWVDEPGQVVRVTGFGLREAELLRVAASVVPLGEPAWRDLVERSQLGLLGTQDGVALARGTLTDGTAWALRADRGGSLDLRVTNDGAGGDSVSSSFSSSPDRLRASVVTESRGRRVLAGLVDPEVTAIEVRSAGGDRLIGVPTHRVELDEAAAAEVGDDVAASSWFVVELTDGADQLVLLDDRGDVLQRHDVRGTGVNPEASATTVPGG